MAQNRIAAENQADRTPDAADVERFLANPAQYFDYSLTRMMGLSPDSLAGLQLAALQHRFAQFRHSLPMLARLADNEGIERVTAIDDVVPLLFDHATYKSYPASLLEKRRFGQLTQWLGKLTTVDLSRIDASSCLSIDDWMLLLDRDSPLSVVHSSGTTGRLSLLPWAKQDWRANIRQYVVLFFQQYGVQPSAPDRLPLNIPCIYPFFRDGGSALTRVNDYLVEMIAGSEHNFHAAYPGRLSADLLLLAARRRDALAKGQLDRLVISPELEARRIEFEAQQREMPQHLANFFAAMRTTLAGQRVFMMASAHLLVGMAEAGLKQGMRNVFDSRSVLISGGGGKGMVLPDDWQQPVTEFFGVERLNLLYSMSEMATQCPMCEYGYYHCPPSIIPFMLDPESGKVLPRTGTVTGRFAFYDLLPQQRWGGFITGDEVTLHWDPSCACGRTSPALDGKIRRFSEKPGFDVGEEKITCASTPGAYEEALAFLNDSQSS